jgi:hypothetical protein
MTLVLDSGYSAGCVTFQHMDLSTCPARGLSVPISFFLFWEGVGLGFKLRASHLQSRCSTI